MGRSILVLLTAALLGACEPAQDGLALPAPRHAGTVTLEEVLAKRRSVRAFSSTVPTRAEIGQLLWAAQGVTSERGFRTAPSAGGLFPLEIYVATKDGVARYRPKEHRLEVLSSRDVRGALYQAALSQDAVRQAPVVFVIAGEVERTARKYGGRATRYVQIEAGHAAQNLLLQATALGLGGVPIGAFKEGALQSALGCTRTHAPLLVVPVGRPE